MILLFIAPNAASHAFKCDNPSMTAKSMATFIFAEMPNLLKDRIGMRFLDEITRQELDDSISKIFNRIDHSDTKD